MFEISEEVLTAARAIGVKLFDVGAHADRPAVFYCCALDGSEGTTSVVRALAESLSRHGETRLLLVDADPGSRELSRVLGLAGTGAEPVPTSLRNVSLMAPPAAEQGAALEGLAQALKSHASAYGAVLVDGVSLAAEPDLAPIKGAIDGVLVVLESERHRREVVAATIAELRAVGVPIAGTILNKKTKWIPEWIYSRL